jgi:hypothetical protein
MIASRSVRAALLTVLVALAPLLARAQAPLRGLALDRKLFREDAGTFRLMLFDGKRNAVNEKLLADKPERSILVILGWEDPTHRIPGGIEKFVRAGGAVLYASDRRITDPKLAEEIRQIAGVSIDDTPITCPDNGEENTFKHNAFCPFVIPVDPPVLPLFDDREAGDEFVNVATNVPGRLLLSPESGLPEKVRRLAYLPSECEAKGADPGFLFAVGGDFGKGRVLVLADHSIFINEMMLTNPGNVDFAFNCLTWLSGDKQERDQVMLLQEGRIRSDVELSMRVPTPSAEDIFRAVMNRRNELLVEAEQYVAKLETEAARFKKSPDGKDLIPDLNLLTPGDPSKDPYHGWVDGYINRLLHSERFPLSAQVLTLLIVLMTLILGYGVWSLRTKGTYLPPAGVPAVAVAVGTQLPGTTLTEQRHREILRSGNLAEAARQLTRDWFDRTGGAEAKKRPRVSASGNWWARRARGRQVARVWEIARGRVRRVTPRQFRALLVLLSELSSAHEAGTLRLEWKGTPSETLNGKGAG